MLKAFKSPHINIVIETLSFWVVVILHCFISLLDSISELIILRFMLLCKAGCSDFWPGGALRLRIGV